ncbi:Transcriptional regulator, LysR family [Pseudomonas chlororaphis]|uniref:Transcriptional regulator, LysR family n=1 Tax=Pseudomonas chlororaphis TaxID=587753 RepID=A0A3G7TQC0_9PSED|nr:LysR family transcriptional regulator [Pseudomonas chlororaphis]AZE48469.1 Transcriptional regulator, LysR family [Pseudomonas chlororaphis]
MKIEPQLLKFFSQVAQHGSFSRAAAYLNVDKSAVSRAVAKLEQQLGMRLLYRNTRALRLTDAGEMVCFEAKKIAESLDVLEHYAETYNGEITGVLRVSCSSGFGRAVLLPAIDVFLRSHPKLEVQLEFEDRFTDLVAENIDVALRHAHLLPDSTLVARLLCESPRVLAAAPAYLARAKALDSPVDLVAHACLAYGKKTLRLDKWQFDIGSEHIETLIRPHVTVNDAEALVQLAVRGLGIVLLDRFLLESDMARGALVEVLPQYRPSPGFSIYAVYPARKWLPRKTTAFIEFVDKYLGKV